MKRYGLVLVLLLAMTACERNVPVSPSGGFIPDTTTVDSLAAVLKDTAATPDDGLAGASFEGDTAAVVRTSSRRGAATLVGVRAARHSAFDRVVFEFDGSDLPPLRLSFVTPPVTDCGAGNEMDVTGNALLEVRFTDANAHTADGRATLPWREQGFALPMLREVERTCDFEGHVTYVLGLASPTAFRVHEPSNPPRLVVDVQHSQAP